MIIDRVQASENLKKAFINAVTTGYKSIAPAIVHAMSVRFINTPEVQEILSALATDDSDDKQKVAFFIEQMIKYEEVIKAKDEEISNLSEEVKKFHVTSEEVSNSISENLHNERRTTPSSTNKS